MNHSHHEQNNQIKNIQLAFFLNFFFAIAEIIGGLYTNSMAIIADALHDLGDSLTLGVSWQLERIAQKQETMKYSYGYRRFSLLGAIANAIVLIGGSVLVLMKAIPRLITPEESDAQGMLFFAMVGIFINGFAVLRMRQGKSMNSRMLTLHLLEDVLGWMAVFIVAIILMFTDFHFLDPLLSLLITSYVLYNVVKNLRKTLGLFLQAVPDEVQIEKIESELKTYPKVLGIHHTHIWSLDGEHHVLTTHVMLTEDAKKEDIRNIKCMLRDLKERFGLEHTTIEFEYSEEDCSMNHQVVEKVNNEY